MMSLPKNHLKNEKSPYLLQHVHALLLESHENKKEGISIRLIKDSTSLTHGQRGTYYGNDGTRYNTICIGNQEWLCESITEITYRNGDLIPQVTDGTSWSNLSTGAYCAYNNDWSNAFVYP